MQNSLVKLKWVSITWKLNVFFAFYAKCRGYLGFGDAKTPLTNPFPTFKIAHGEIRCFILFLKKNKYRIKNNISEHKKYFGVVIHLITLELKHFFIFFQNCSTIDIYGKYKKLKNKLFCIMTSLLIKSLYKYCIYQGG